jgi:hypothetical protein
VATKRKGGPRRKGRGSVRKPPGRKATGRGSKRKGKGPKSPKPGRRKPPKPTTRKTPPKRPARPGRMPTGFQPVGAPPRKPRPPGLGGPGRVKRRKPGEVAQQIRDTFDRWRERLFTDEQIVRALGLRKRSRFTVDRTVVPRADGSVSASFDIDGIDKRLPIDRLLLALGMAMQGSAINGAWMSVGFRFPSSADIVNDITYKKVHGAVQIRSHTRRFVTSLVPYIIAQARDLHDRMRAAHRFRAHAIFVRVWWYPRGKRPKRTRTER